MCDVGLKWSFCSPRREFRQFRLSVGYALCLPLGDNVPQIPFFFLPPLLLIVEPKPTHKRLHWVLWVGDGAMRVLFFGGTNYCFNNTFVFFLTDAGGFDPAGQQPF